MDRSFPEILSSLRKERGINQRAAAAALGISQALLSHYENGAREPGLGFVCRACDYYGVSADYLLGRSDTPDAAAETAETAADYLGRIQALAFEARAALGAYPKKENHP